MRYIIGLSIWLFAITLNANFNFGECSGSDTFEQKIVYYNGDYENAATVGEIPKGIKGLKISLVSNRDVDIRLYGENGDKIVHWPYGILRGASKKTKSYKNVPVTYSGYNGVDGEKGHEFIEIKGITPTAMKMKAFGYKAGYATVNYSWTGKEGCSAKKSGKGSFTQTLKRGKILLVGTIPPNVNNVQIDLTSSKDLDIQLYAQDGSAIVSWKPRGMLWGSAKQSIEYHGMHIEWSGYNGTNGHKGDEYIKITPKTTELLTMKVYGYEAGTAVVAYSWGDGNVTSPVLNGEYMLTAWNDLGMHCMDGSDFSVFSVLPPYNNLHAQLKDKSGELVTSGVSITYEATQGMDGQINTTSIKTNSGKQKTNFWEYAPKLFGVVLQADNGLTGNPMSSLAPAPMKFNTTHQWWEAEGIPISPYNDNGSKNYYPLVKVTAKDSTGKILAQVKTVLPVSDEMDCKRCHASGSGNDAKPKVGWVNHSNAEKDYKFNILRLHDEKEPRAVSKNLAALQSKGFNYNTKGLEAIALGGTPVLCVACHKSNALPGVGIGIKAFTNAIHSKHATVVDPLSGMQLGDSKNRTACYACHPGAQTKCLRGAMGDAKKSDGTSKIQCQSCHGDMHAVGDNNREGWFDEPNCQACHHDGKQETSAIDPTTNTLRYVIDKRFATNLNAPVVGVSLYRFSKGHGGLQCEACHGATHAIYPAHNADNLLSEGVQGHSGTISECTACHSSVPHTVTGGPHGMHPIGDAWVKGHEDIAEDNPTQCKACHGKDYRGSPLSKMWKSRTLKVEHSSKTLSKGHQVSCYDCHNGPDGE